MVELEERKNEKNDLLKGTHMKEGLPEKFNYKKNKVAIVKLDDYNPDNIRKALESIIDLLGVEDFFKEKTVLLKPNVLSASDNTFTPAEIVVEVIKYLKKDGGAKEISVGDSTLTKTITRNALKSSEIKERSEAENAKVFNFFESEREKIELKNPIPDVEESIFVPKEISDADIVINLPKLKTHTGFVYTGAIKNLFGILGNKQKMHMTHSDKNNFQKMLADIYFAVEETNETNKPKVLTIMDAVIAMEGKGPQFGKPRKVGLMIAGFNSAAVDIIGYTLMNGNPTDLEAISSLANRTELPIDIDQLDILGDVNYKDYIMKDFKKPEIKLLKKEGYSMKWLPSFIANRIMRISIKINKKKCILCERCVKHCPAEAMVRKDDQIILNDEKCIECYCCGESCPNDAIDAKWNLFRLMPYLIALIAIGSVAIIWLIVFLITNA